MPRGLRERLKPGWILSLFANEIIQSASHTSLIKKAIFICTTIFSGSWDRGNIVRLLRGKQCKYSCVWNHNLYTSILRLRAEIKFSSSCADRRSFLKGKHFQPQWLSWYCFASAIMTHPNPLQSRALRKQAWIIRCRSGTWQSRGHVGGKLGLQRTDTAWNNSLGSRCVK